MSFRNLGPYCEACHRAFGENAELTPKRNTMARAAARTGIMPIALVAVEQTFPEGQRVLQDPLAYHMLPPGAKLFARLLRWRWVRDRVIRMSERSQPGIWGGLLCRKRYIDEQLSALPGDVAAIVNLGAGFDTRMYRLPNLTGLPIWELDQPENISIKEKRLRRIWGAIPSNIRLVPIDFDREEVREALVSAGYSMDRRTFFVWEAVTQYLTEDGLKKTFNFLSGAAAGSHLVFTYVRRDFLEGKALYGWEAGYKRFVSSHIWHSGLDPESLAAWLRPYGWKIVEDAGYDELAATYIPATGRSLGSTPVERMVHAVRG